MTPENGLEAVSDIKSKDSQREIEPDFNVVTILTELPDSGEKILICNVYDSCKEYL
jgi:hypothetical protein